MTRKRDRKPGVQKKKLKPNQIPLVEGAEFGEGAIFARLPSFQELMQFWETNHKLFPYSAEGLASMDGEYLNRNEWVFGRTKEAVIKAVVRWDQLGIDCAWYDWAQRCPEAYADFLASDEDDRAACLKTGTWSDEKEQRYQLFRPPTYTGWWRVTHLPGVHANEVWFEGTEEVSDRGLPKPEVASILQRMMFDQGVGSETSQLSFGIELREASGMEAFLGELNSDPDGKELYFKRESPA